MVSSRPATRSVAFARKSRLLCATALIGVLLPIVAVHGQEASYRYEQTGTYTDDIAINRAVTMSTAAGTIATYTGNLSFQEAGSTLDLGSGGSDHGTIVFSPETVAGIETSPGSYSGLLRLWDGRFQFGQAAAREYFAQHGTRVAMVGDGVLDLAGSDLNFYNFSKGSGRGTVRNDTAGTTATFSVTTGSIGGGLRDGAGVLRLRKVGAGGLILGGVSDYSGGTEIAYGHIVLDTATAIGSGEIEFSSDGPSGAMLDLRANGLNLANNILVQVGLGRSSISALVNRLLWPV